MKDYMNGKLNGKQKKGMNNMNTQTMQENYVGQILRVATIKDKSGKMPVIAYAPGGRICLFEESFDEHHSLTPGMVVDVMVVSILPYSILVQLRNIVDVKLPNPPLPEISIHEPIIKFPKPIEKPEEAPSKKMIESEELPKTRKWGKKKEKSKKKRKRFLARGVSGLPHTGFARRLITEIESEEGGWIELVSFRAKHKISPTSYEGQLMQKFVIDLWTHGLVEIKREGDRNRFVSIRGLF